MMKKHVANLMMHPKKMHLSKVYVAQPHMMTEKHRMHEMRESPAYEAREHRCKAHKFY